MMIFASFLHTFVMQSKASSELWLAPRKCPFKLSCRSRSPRPAFWQCWSLHKSLKLLLNSPVDYRRLGQCITGGTKRIGHLTRAKVMLNSMDLQRLQCASMHLAQLDETGTDGILDAGIIQASEANSDPSMFCFQKLRKTWTECDLRVTFRIQIASKTL